MPSYYCSAEADDGFVRGSDTAYATARSTSSFSDVASDEAYIGQWLNAGTYNVYRGYIRFDTSDIPDGSTVTDVKLYLCVESDRTGGADFVLDVYKFNWSAPLADSREANYDASGAAVDQTWRDMADGISADTYYYNATTLDVTWVNKSGYTYYMLKSQEDVNNSAPGGEEFIGIWVTPKTGTSKDPYLKVTYTVAQTQAFQWDLRSLVTQTKAFAWDIGGLVRQTKQFVWDLFGAFTSPVIYTNLPDNDIEVTATPRIYSDLPDNAITTDLGDNQE